MLTSSNPAGILMMLPNIKASSRLQGFLILLIILLFGSFRAYPQFYNGSQLTFGKNRVQYADFQWTYFRFNNIDVYYYLNGKELALHTAEYARLYLPEIERKLETSLDHKVQFIVYNTYTDLRQSNLGLMNNLQYNTGGITHIIGHKIFLYFDGNMNNFDRQIRAGIARMLLEGIIYGQSIGSQIKNNTLINLPAWFSDGLVSYYSRNWDTELDNILKDGIMSGRYHKFNHLNGMDAVYAGHSIWRFIAEKYGPDNISNIVYMTRVNRSVESGFLYVLGVSYKNIMKEWEAWYKNIYETQAKQSFTDYGQKLKIRTKNEKVFDRVKVSPDGENVAYTTNEYGLYKVMLYKTANGKQKRIFRKGFRLDDKVDYSYPLLAWHPTGKILAMIIEFKGLNYLYFYDVDERKWTKQNIYGFQKVLDFSYSPDGRSFVFSAVIKGQSDIFLYNIAANSTEQITRDIYNDLNPRYLFKSSKLIFSSNRPDDTLRIVKDEMVSYDGLENHDLFMYDLANRSKTLTRITHTPLANEIQPMSYEPGSFAYLSDANGVFNRYIARFDSAIAYVDTTVHYRYFASSQPITNLSRSILTQDISPIAGKSAEIYFEKNRYHLYLNELSSKPASSLELSSSDWMKAREIKAKQEAEIRQKQKAEPQKKVNRKRFYNVYYEDIPQKKPDSLNIDLNNYQLSSGILQGKPSQGLLREDKFGRMVPFGEKPKPPKSRNYNVEYSINQLISQLDFSYLNMSYQPFIGYAGPIFQNPPTNALFTVGATDLMEDYRIIGGVRLNSDLTNNEYLLGFANLKHRTDREVYFHRSSFDVSYLNAYVRHRVHELHYVMRYPFTEVLALKGTASMQSDKLIVLALDQATAKMKGENNFWGIIKGELVFDNTRDLGTNLYQGMRFKVFGEFYRLIATDWTNLSVVGFDFRHYTRIHRSFIWANRLAGSTSFGKSKLLYYLGGIDNWLIPGFDTTNQIDYSQNYAFQTLATNMRGFKQNVRSGNSFAVLNSELRFPVFKYFFNRPLKSDFLNNFQIVGFGDLGAAWKGLDPLSEENTFFTRTIYNPPVYVTVKVQKSPLVAGYGFGLRSTLLGYFLRADWSWGIEDNVVQPRQFYLSLSLDF
ncbi:MAG: PD40 domain-containing protein [Bacteroidales bacterium]|nr:PD40 domain-containing protein [Bacteroidales bacterium]